GYERVLSDLEDPYTLHHRGHEHSPASSPVAVTGHIVYAGIGGSPFRLGGFPARWWARRGRR
ncbi:hypothetical protein MXD62_27025, partial [Frankia sp. Mgl5]|uniref:hypothetical protein n=1 Tax=Frankia sp. Mgl5 TaxID=2933793 RepID=UPI00200D49C1